MKKAILFCAVFLLFAACNNNNSPSPADLDVVPGDYFSELMVKWLGAVSPESVTVETKIKNTKRLDLTIKGYDLGELVSECAGSVDLSDADYQNVLALIKTANLYEYKPPEISDSNCAPPVGSAGVTVSYIRSDDTHNQFTTLCTLDEDVTKLLDAVDMLAEKYVTDCTWDMVAGNLSEAPPES